MSVEKANFDPNLPIHLNTKAEAECVSAFLLHYCANNIAMQNLRFLLIAVLALAMVVCSVRLFQVETERRELNEDLIEISKIKYGLFNADEWKRIASEVIAKKIDEFELGKGNRQTWEIKISNFLYKLISDLEDRFTTDNNATFLGKIKNLGSDFFGVFGKMKKDVPQFTQEILNFLENPANRKELKKFLNEKVNQYADSTFTETNYIAYDAILEQGNYADGAQAKAGMKADLETLSAVKRKWELGMYACLLSLLLIAVVSSALRSSELLVLSSASLLPLAGGLVFPMLEIDARIERLAFTLLGEPIVFTDQVLYFKSKSILEVVSLMLSQGKLDLMAVGILVLLFSVIFPVSKIIASISLLSYPSWGRYAVVRFMVFKTGKWSMADVMVVAIFMAHIGFAGILSEQLAQLERISLDLDVLTTNRSNLQSGFFLFAGFVILSLAISHQIGKMNLINKPL